MIIIGGSASQELATKVAKELDVEFSAPLVKKFPDGELYVQVACEMKDQEVTVIQSTYRPQNDHLIELLFILDIASDHGAKKVTAIIPYLSYARQDKRFKSGEAL
ncbi:MAG: ribose-phosphate diphosphokinase, partial [Euryarchaeota archaeon]|nr:ribose-phosphate diphosphokinase [Euryarchaeota archaeon]